VSRRAASTGIHLATKAELWPIEKLKPYDRNPKRHSPARVAEMAMLMLEFGFTSPIEVSTKDGILAGHRRLLAARKLNLTHVPVINHDHLTPEQSRAYRIIHNRSSENGDYEPGILAGEIDASIKAGFTHQMLGFTDQDIRELEKSIEEPKERAPRGRRAGKILYMLEFDNEGQKDAWLEFRGWLLERAGDGSFPAALTTHVRKAMTGGKKN
jgi:ParB-like chromosome segregation protein Spo0J